MAGPRTDISLVEPGISVLELGPRSKFFTQRVVSLSWRVVEAQSTSSLQTGRFLDVIEIRGYGVMRKNGAEMKDVDGLFLLDIL